MITELEFKNHDEWLAIRHKYIGGSDSSAVVGMNPYKSRYALWAEKTDKMPGFEGNITTKVGAYLEELVAQMFEEETGKKVRRKNRTMVNDLYPFACANIDRAIVGEKAFLEIKTTNSIPIMKQLRKTEFPSAYYCQCVHYLAVTGLQKAYLAVLINCRDFKIYELDRDQAEIDALMQAEKDFWHLVETNTEPDVDGEDSTGKALNEVYPIANDREIDLSPMSRDIKEYLSLKSQIDELTKLKDEKGNAIKAYMKDAKKGYCNGYSISLPAVTKNTFDAKRYAEDHKDLDISAYYKPSTSRQLRITEKEN